MRVRLTEVAEADLREIGNFIAVDNPVRAESFVLELLERCLGLGEHSARYPVVFVWHERQVRRCPFGSYLIFYSVIDSELEVNHIVHGARDYVRLLFPDD